MAVSKKKSAKSKKSPIKKTVLKKPLVKKALRAAKRVAKPVGKAAAKPAKKKATAKTALRATPVPKDLRSKLPSLSDLEQMITPLNDRILVMVDLPETTTPGGLIIPVTAAEGPNRGKVLAIGPGRRNRKGSVRPLDVTVGDHVLFYEYAGSKVQIQGAELLILREEEILGIAE